MRCYTTQFFKLAVLVGLIAGMSRYAEAQNDQMVLLNVRVTDSFRQAIPNLSKEKFQVVEDGVPQKIEFFSSDQVPLSYGMVIDNSGSLRSQFERVVVTGIQIVNNNTDKDQAFLVRFVDSDKLEVTQESTSDRKLLIEGLQSLYVENGETALVDAVYLAAEKLAKLSGPGDKLQRKALIVITDGEDRHSYYTVEQLFSLLAKTDIQVFVVGLISEVDVRTVDNAIGLINRLALDTGGRAFFPKSKVDLELISEAIINDIRTQYVIGYKPSVTTPNEVHKLQVSIAGSTNDGNHIAITKLGYSTTVPR